MSVHKILLSKKTQTKHAGICTYTSVDTERAKSLGKQYRNIPDEAWARMCEEDKLRCFYTSVTAQTHYKKNSLQACCVNVSKNATGVLSTR